MEVSGPVGDRNSCMVVDLCVRASTGQSSSTYRKQAKRAKQEKHETKCKHDRVSKNVKLFDDDRTDIETCFDPEVILQATFKEVDNQKLQERRLLQAELRKELEAEHRLEVEQREVERRRLAEMFRWFDFLEESLARFETEQYHKNSLILLEVGAGNGSFARALLQRVRDLGWPLHYIATNPGTSLHKALADVEAKFTPSRGTTVLKVWNNFDLNDVRISRHVALNKHDLFVDIRGRQETLHHGIHLLIFNNPLHHSYQWEPSTEAEADRAANIQLLERFFRFASQALLPGEGRAIVSFAHHLQPRWWRVDSLASERGLLKERHAPLDMSQLQDTLRDWRTVHSNGTHATYMVHPSVCVWRRPRGEAPPVVLPHKGKGKSKGKGKDNGKGKGKRK